MSVSIGTVIGVKIKLHYTWFIIFALVTWTLASSYMPSQYPGLDTYIYWIVGAISAIALFASVLFHELAHSYVAKKRGLPVPSITLHLFGGVSQIAEEPQNPNLEFSMAVIGPLSSFFLSIIFTVLLYITNQFSLGDLIAAPLSYIAMINLFLGVFNLLPAFPLDGGRMLRAGIWKWKDDLVNASRTATKISKGIAYLMIGMGIFGIIFGIGIGGLWLVFIGWFIKDGAESSLKQTIVTKALADVTVKQIMNQQLVTITPDQSLGEAVDNYFYRYKHGGFPVASNEELLGIITIQDVKKIPKEERMVTKVEEAMTPERDLITVKPDESAMEALVKLSKHDVGRLPVLEEGKLIGILTRSDLLRAIRTRTELGVEAPTQKLPE